MRTIKGVSEPQTLESGNHASNGDTAHSAALNDKGNVVWIRALCRAAARLRAQLYYLQDLAFRPGMLGRHEIFGSTDLPLS